MPKPEQQALITRLRNTARGGGWGYSPTTPAAAEPTALAILALHVSREESARALAQSGSAWLAEQQRTDGAVNVVAGLNQTAWTTSLAILAWRKSNPDQFKPHVARAVEWLTWAKGLTGDAKLSEGQHDPTIVGWSWVENTHSWVEPTAYAVLALRAAGMAEHVRTRDGVRLLRDRAIESGGWNYGNSHVLANTLRPFPETTGVALTALAGLGRDAAIDRAIAFLKQELPRLRTPLALGWGLIGLHAWGERPAESAAWIGEAIAQSNERPANAQHDALLLLASADEPLSVA